MNNGLYDTLHNKRFIKQTVFNQGQYQIGDGIEEEGGQYFELIPLMCPTTKAEDILNCCCHFDYDLNCYYYYYYFYFNCNF